MLAVLVNPSLFFFSRVFFSCDITVSFDPYRAVFASIEKDSRQSAIHDTETPGHVLYLSD